MRKPNENIGRNIKSHTNPKTGEEAYKHLTASTSPNLTPKKGDQKILSGSIRKHSPSPIPKAGKNYPALDKFSVSYMLREIIKSDTSGKKISTGDIQQIIAQSENLQQNPQATHRKTRANKAACNTFESYKRQQTKNLYSYKNIDI